MARKKKTVEIVPETKPAKVYPNHGKSAEDLIRINRSGGAPIYDGVQDLILEVMPDAVSNNNVKFPVKLGDKLLSVKDIVVALETKHEFRAQELWAAYKKFNDRVGCSIFVQMAIIELENQEA